MSRVPVRDRDRPGVAEVVFRGLAGHPLHPPLTDATIGMFVLATGLRARSRTRRARRRGWR
jgi:hypothetical protein